MGRRNEQEAHASGTKQRHKIEALARVASKRREQEVQARCTLKRHQHIRELWNLASFGIRRMPRQGSMQQDIQAHSMFMCKHKQKRTAPEKYPKMLSKCLKIALTRGLEGVLEALLLQTSIEDALQVDFFQIWAPI